ESRVLLRATANVVGIPKLRRPIGAIHRQFSTASTSSSSFSVKPIGGIGEGANLISGRQLVRFFFSIRRRSTAERKERFSNRLKPPLLEVEIPLGKLKLDSSPSIHG
ncbi:unnamed protein product, partial [Arabidopsis halleri]